jgi:hypothetical protein
MSRVLYFCTISSYGCLYVCYYVHTCSLCVVFLGQAFVLYIDLLMCLLSLYIFLVMCVLLSVVELVYHLKYGIVCVNVCVVHV